MKRVSITYAVFLIVLVSCPLFAQKRTYTTRRINPHPPVIDGHFDDAAWNDVNWASDYVQRKPYDGREPSQETAIKILYDDRNIYVAIRAYDTEPDKIVRRMTRRDNIDGDVVSIQLDSYFDHRTAFLFLVNAAGVKIDGISTDEKRNVDFSSDPIWYVKTALNDEGWNAEMQIPLSQLRFGNQQNQVWGLQAGRKLFRKEELSYWQPIPIDAPGWMHLFGELHGITGIKPSRRIEILPYSVGKMETMEKEEGNPFVSGSSYNMNIGLDGKIGISSDLTLDFTVNPDFGQVEADPSVVNLTTFETFYEEKRPFFIEGKNIVDYKLMLGEGKSSNDNLFYSRRIGRSPSYEPDLEDEENMNGPANTTIIAALKLTGKTRTGLSVGIMDAVTREEKAEIDDNGQRRTIRIEPMTNYFLGRLQKDYNKGCTTIGGIVTNTTRNIEDSYLDFLNKTATTGGFDFRHEWKERTYFLALKTIFSHIHGSKEAISEAQTASTRYFQRPDADHVTLDSSRTSLSGHGGFLYLGKTGSGHWNFQVGSIWRSPGLELNDMGYLRRADMIIGIGHVEYRYLEPFSIFRNLNIKYRQWRGWNFGKENMLGGYGVSLLGQFRNYWQFGMKISSRGETLSASSLRGGPSLLLPSQWAYGLNLSSDQRRVFQVGLISMGNLRSDGYSRTHSFHPQLTLRPSNALSFSFDPFYETNKDNLQYIDTIEENDNRYVLGRIDQKTVGIVLRINYSVTPTFSIQYYGQPFVSAGKYTQLKCITNPRAKVYTDRFHTYAEKEIVYNSDDEEYYINENHDEIMEYSIENPDFNIREFRSNLVIRWEYNPGSTLYFVWSQGRSDEVSKGIFSFKNDMQDLFQLYPHDVFLIKFNHWFSL